MQKKKWDKWFVAGLIFSLLIITFYIFFNTKNNAQSDWATAVLLAREQMRSGQWFPDSWVYAQSIWGFSLNLLVMPFLYVTNNMLIARELAVFVQTILCLWTCYAAMQCMVKKNSALLVCILLLVPMSAIVNRNFFFEATYFAQVFWMAVLILVADKICCVQRTSKKKLVSWCLVCVGISAALSLGDAKELVRIIVPFVGAVIVALGIKHKADIKSMLTEYRAVILCFVTLLGTAMGLFLQQKIKTSVLFDEGVAKIIFSDTSDWGSNLSVIFASFAEMYGLDAVGDVVSLHGVVSILKGAVAILLTLGIPTWAVCSYKKLRNIYQQIFVIYSLFSAFLMIYICMISDSVGESARYFLGIYINNMILAGICFDCVLNENVNWRRLTLTGVMGVTAVCAVQYRNYSEIDYNNFQEVIAFLQNQNVHYGYADYWNAGVTTVLSNGEVELVAYESGRQGTPLYWLCSTEWYEPEYHKGDFCFVIKDGEYLDERYRQEADEIHRVGAFEILIFREDGESTAKLFFAFPQKVGDSYTFYGDNFYFRSKCGIVEGSSLVSQGSGALAYGQYCVLAPGTYRLEVDMEVAGTSGCSVEMACASTVFSSTWFGNGNGYVIDNIVVPERAIGSEIRIMLGGDTEVTLRSITITKVK